MSEYFYIQSEPGLWTVGTGDPKVSSQWFPESDHESPEAAAKRVAFLNGNVEMKDSEALAKYSAERIEQQAARIKELEAFVQKFSENFGKCWCCEGTGTDAIGDACRICGGTGKEVASTGILLSELEPEARAILAKG
jgi:excinuclease UvrABC ATPase subunit